MPCYSFTANWGRLTTARSLVTVSEGALVFQERRGFVAVDLTTLAVLAVIFLATVIRSAFGFGEALVAVPLLALIIPVEVAAPLAVLVSVTVAGVVLLQDWREVHAGSAGRLILATVFGIPFGLLLLVSVPEPLVKAVLAAVIMAFSAYCLFGRSRFELKDDRLACYSGLAPACSEALTA